MLKFVAITAVLGAMFLFTDISNAQAQTTVTTYYQPAPSVGYVPVRRGLLGLRTGWVPVVAQPAPVPVTTYYAPAPVTTFYAPSPTVTTFYAPPAVSTVTPVTTYYAPAPVPVTTYYAPPVIIHR